MSIIGNIIWFLFGGILAGIIWYLVGLLWCLTIIGIPVGLQCFKLGRLSFFPFGKDVALSGETTSLLLNIFWLIFGGIELAITHAVFAVIFIGFLVNIFFLLKIWVLPNTFDVKLCDLPTSNGVAVEYFCIFFAKLPKKYLLILQNRL